MEISDITSEIDYSIDYDNDSREHIRELVDTLLDPRYDTVEAYSCNSNPDTISPTIIFRDSKRRQSAKLEIDGSYTDYMTIPAAYNRETREVEFGYDGGIHTDMGYDRCRVPHNINLMRVWVYNGSTDAIVIVTAWDGTDGLYEILRELPRYMWHGIGLAVYVEKDYDGIIFRNNTCISKGSVRKETRPTSSVRMRKTAKETDKYSKLITTDDDGKFKSEMPMAKYRSLTSMDESIGNADYPLYHNTSAVYLADIMRDNALKSGYHRGYPSDGSTHNGICFTRDKSYNPYTYYDVRIKIRASNLLRQACKKGVRLIPYQDDDFYGIDEYEERLVSRNGKPFTVDNLSDIVDEVLLTLDNTCAEALENGYDTDVIVEDIRKVMEGNIFGSKLRIVDDLKSMREIPMDRACEYVKREIERYR